MSVINDLTKVFLRYNNSDSEEDKKMNKNIIAKFLIGLTLISTPVFADSILQPATDSVNSGIINTKILANDSLKNIDINATVEKGVAIFSGRVNSKAQLDELIRIGHSVSGVNSVNVSKVRIEPK